MYIIYQLTFSRRWLSLYTAFYIEWLLGNKVQEWTKLILFYILLLLLAVFIRREQSFSKRWLIHCITSHYRLCVVANRWIQTKNTSSSVFLCIFIPLKQHSRCWCFQIHMRKWETNVFLSLMQQKPYVVVKYYLMEWS